MLMAPTAEITCVVLGALLPFSSRAAMAATSAPDSCSLKNRTWAVLRLGTYSSPVFDSMTSPLTLNPLEHCRPPTEQMLPDVEAFARPRAARWLKLLSFRPPVSVTRPTLIVGVVPPPLVVLPHAATTMSAMNARPRNLSCERTILGAPFKELNDSERAGRRLLLPVLAGL